MTLQAEVYSKAVELLSRREHSRQELTQKLTTRFTRAPSAGAKPDAGQCSDAELNILIAAVCERLEHQGYLSDQRFAESYVNARSKKGFGRLRVLNELQQKGVAGDLAEATVSALMGSTEASRQLFVAWQKKFGKPPEDYKERARQQRFLMYRGFSAAEIDKLFQKLASQPTDSNSEDVHALTKLE